MFHHSTREPTAYDDDFEDQPGQGPAYQWGLGLGLPVVLVWRGAKAWQTHLASYGIESSIALHGSNASALAVAVIAIALFLHFHYFWGNIYNQAWWAVLGKILSAAVFIAASVWILFRAGVLGIT